MSIFKPRIDERLFFPATVRNREPILNILRQYLPKKGSVLEVASGSGEHITYFAGKLKNLTWHPSELEASLLPSIFAWTKELKLQKIVSPPLPLDARMKKWPVNQITNLTSILAINLIHISPFTVCTNLFKNASIHLNKGGVVFLYGPYKINGSHSAQSNIDFDASLKLQNPEWGVRDLAVVTDLGAKFNFSIKNIIKMPANNMSLIFKKK